MSQLCVMIRPKPAMVRCAKFDAAATWLLTLVVLLGLMSTPVAADPNSAPPPRPTPKTTQPVYSVSAFNIAFDRDVTSQGIDTDKLKQHPLSLAFVNGVYTQPQPGADTLSLSLEQLDGDKPRQYDITALRIIIDSLLDYLTEDAQLIGVLVAPSPNDIGIDLTDRREDRTDLTIVVRLAVVGQVRSLASGDRIAPDDREDHPDHTRLRAVSPLQASTTLKPASLINRGELDDYLYRLNRHPGRRVDAAISPGLNPGEVSLDYLVAENKPWYAYFQLANNGTDSTNDWRERFGFVHNQLTNNDDILSIDYITAGFDESHVITIGYTRPVSERLEARFNGLFSTFSADQVGSPLAFTGEDAAGGAALAYNIHQDGPLFIDAVAGLEYYFTSANNPATLIEGEAHFLLGTAGFELEHVTDLSQTYGTLKLRGNLNQESPTDLATLGRTAPDTQFITLQYGLTTSFYLEPLLNRAAWQDITDPSTSTLAHEIAFGLRGQWALNDDRMVPTFQAVAGGLNSARGYEQADVAADSSLIMTAEYRFHLPRVFGIEKPRVTRYFDRPFRVAPESVYGRPDWDLVFKGFVDYAVMDVSNELAFETDDTLLSTGLGIELALKNNLNMRADWGVALQDAGSTESGDSRLHFVLTLIY